MKTLSDVERNRRQRQREEVLRGALKLKGAAHYLSVSEITVRRLVDRGLITPNKATRHLLFPLSELDRFLKS